MVFDKESKMDIVSFDELPTLSSNSGQIGSPCDDLLTSKSYQGQTERLLENIHRWNFSIFTLNKFTDGKALSHLCLSVFHEYDLIRAFNLDVFR